ncbi:DUF4396 domain-containing protein [Methylobacterium sp. P31]
MVRKIIRGLSPGEGIVAALKADTLSLIFWQVGMYGSMALAQFALLPALGAPPADLDTAWFWFPMPIAMVAGFVTACPVNGWLVSAGARERMPRRGWRDAKVRSKTGAFVPANHPVSHAG